MSARRNAVLLAVVVALGGCGGVKSETKLNAVPKVEEAKAEARKAGAGVFADKESDCIMDKLFARSDLDVGQIMDYAKKPEQTGPVAAAYKEIVPSCIDPTATVAPAPMSDDLRKSFVAGVKSGLPTATDQQVNCLIDALLASGLTPRDFALAGYLPAYQEKLGTAFGAAGTKCGLSG